MTDVVLFRKKEMLGENLDGESSSRGNMTIELNEGDRIYKIIEARTVGSIRKRFVSKIDKNNKITAFIYTFSNDDIKEDGTVDNKETGMLIKGMDEDQFKFAIDTNYQIYPGFKILLEKDYSDKSLKEAIELMDSENSIVYKGNPYNNCELKSNVSLGIAYLMKPNRGLGTIINLKPKKCLGQLKDCAYVLRCK